MEMIGLAAAFCTTIAFVPQVIQMYRTKVTDGVSLGMYCIFSLGVFLWLIYGVLIQSLSLILANGVTLVLALCVLVMKIRYTLKFSRIRTIS